ncbi:molybdopterin molybdotransferase [Azomonas agilis]|uniref:Molybdopterin molybdenumtransferase n=1 Tax=Azomonas agilis TaxID=116849 RepID=A0A562J0G7_9GAMM|nr:gephyrin-like molybdotransferase Glp [Azomonas agilis]TWH76769.1 molybdopterin molybdotransferase [Azomonas agilis]
MSLDPCAEPALLNVSALQQKLLESLSPLPIEIRRLTDSLGMVLAESIWAQVANPRFDNAAMDGFALGADAVAHAPGVFPLSGLRLAGSDNSTALAPNAAMRITTGARVPQGTVSVVMQEHCSATENEVTVLQGVKSGQNIRWQGEDIQPGQCLLEAGTRIQARHIMLLASQGLAEVRVHRQPVVAVISTGDELRAPGMALGESSIFDSNRPYLLARLHQAGVRVIDLGIIPDDPHKIREALNEAAHQADLIVSSGGVSVGQADWLKRCIEELGELLHWKVKLKPGKPVAWGKVKGTPFLGLPGNPVSTLVCGELFLITALNQLEGSRQPLPRFVRLPIARDYKRKPGRDEFLRAALVYNTEPSQVEILSDQGSASLAGLARTDALLHIAADVAEIKGGTLVDVLLL